MKIQNTTDTNKRIRLTALDSAMSNIDDSVGAVAKVGREVLLCLAPKGKEEEEPSFTLPMLTISKATAADLANPLAVGLGSSDEHGWFGWYDSKMSDNNFSPVDYFDIIQGDMVANNSDQEIVIHSYLPSGPFYGNEPRHSPWDHSQTALWNFEEVLLPLLVSIAEKADPETVIFATSYPPYEPEEGEEEEFDPTTRVDIRAKEFLNPNAGELNWLRDQVFQNTVYLDKENQVTYTVYDSDGITVLGEYNLSVKQTVSLRHPEFDTVAVAPINVPGYVGTATGTFGFTHMETSTNFDDLNEFFIRQSAGDQALPLDDDFGASGLIKFTNGVNTVVGSVTNFVSTGKENTRGLKLTLNRDGSLHVDIKQPGEYYVTMMIHAATPLSIDDIAPIPGLTPKVDYHRNETLDMYAMYVTYHFKAS